MIKCLVILVFAMVYICSF